jgi:hypothetical protein
MLGQELTRKDDSLFLASQRQHVVVGHGPIQIADKSHIMATAPQAVSNGETDIYIHKESERSHAAANCRRQRWTRTRAAVCGRCGRRLHTRYSNQPAYVCEVAASQNGDAIRQTFMVPYIDEAVTRVLLEAVQPAHLEVALAALEEVEA